LFWLVSSTPEGRNGLGAMGTAGAVGAAGVEGAAGVGGGEG
jgi:hypothetical protein